MKPEPTTLPPVVTTPNRSRMYDDDFQEAMRANPGEWFFVETRDFRPSYPWAKQKIEGLQVSTRKNASEGIDVYARIQNESK